MKNSLRANAKRGSLAGMASVGAAALLLTGCGPAPQAGSPTATASDYTGCIVSDSGGFDDQSFNQSSYEGLKKSEKDLGIKVNQVESKTNNDFEPNLRAMVSAGCNLTVTVGFLLGDATKKQAESNPNSHFAIIDFGYAKPIANVKPIIYDTAQAAFMAGLPGSGFNEDRHGGNLRRHQDPDGHHLHGRLRGRREVLQREEGQERQAPRLGQGQAGRQLHRRLRKAGQGQAADPEFPGPGC